MSEVELGEYVSLVLQSRGIDPAGTSEQVQGDAPQELSLELEAQLRALANRQGR